MAATCHGNGPDHCCTFQGVTCTHLEENTVEGRRWACGLYREHGSWEAVYEDPRYKADVQPMWDEYRRPNVGCGDWPVPGVLCIECGARGR